MIDTIGAVVRWDIDGNPYLLDDAGHRALGLTNPYNTSHFLVIEFAVPFTKIITATTCVDETLVVSGVTAGASVGLDKMSIRICQQGAPTSPFATVLRQPKANLFVSVMGVYDD